MACARPERTASVPCARTQRNATQRNARRQQEAQESMNNNTSNNHIVASKENTTTNNNNKVLVRFLPATLSRDAFWKLVEERMRSRGRMRVGVNDADNVDDVAVSDKVLYWYYAPGKSGYVITTPHSVHILHPSCLFSSILPFHLPSLCSS